jgi:hypothetical protein
MRPYHQRILPERNQRHQSAFPWMLQHPKCPIETLDPTGWLLGVECIPTISHVSVSHGMSLAAVKGHPWQGVDGGFGWSRQLGNTADLSDCGACQCSECVRECWIGSVALIENSYSFSEAGDDVELPFKISHIFCL